MGVVYKLNPDVIDSIITQKIDSPQISCRQLASLISNKYQMHVSKSSVNAVLKNAQLSSCVGRRSTIIKKESFHIPQETKLNLKKNMAELGFGPLNEKPKPVSMSASAHDEPISLLPDPLQKKPMPDKNEEVVVSAEPENALQPDHEQSLQRNFVDKIEKIRINQRANKGPLHQGMGYIFLKAAQWELTSSSVLGNLLRKHVQVARPDNFEDLIESLLYLHFLDVQSFDDTNEYFQHALWAINTQTNSYHQAYLRILFDALRTEKLNKSLLFEYHQQMEQAAIEVNGYQLYLDDETQIAIDAQLMSVGQNFLGQTWPVNKAMEQLSHQIISNNHSFISMIPSDQIGLTNDYYNLISIFENLTHKRIKKISIFDQEQKEIACFDTIPSIKRVFMLGLRPWHNGFKELSKSNRWIGRKPFYHPVMDRIFYFSETKTEFLNKHISGQSGPFKVVTLWHDKVDEPVLLFVTNKVTESAENLIYEFILRWPSFGDDFSKPSLSKDVKLSDLAHQPIKDPLSDGQNLWDLFSGFTNDLHEYNRKHFFGEKFNNLSINDLFTSVYNVSGYIKPMNGAFKVTFKIPDGYKYRVELENSINRVNQSFISDFFGRRCVLSIDG